ncbi:MAG: M20 family metallopeptidase [Verrucomicrobiales bacterium]|nr:M20 family metallopeptidase [Verrucomicrobiales bacterium]MCP5560288.1 M20 family metallopeptidase [Verrucomicrobiaceae bacterium]
MRYSPSMSPVLSTLADLVRINSVNSSYEGGPGEAGVAAYVREFFASRRIETWEQVVFPGRNNVIARLPGRKSGRRLIYEAHMDTVSVKGMTIDPFDPVVRDGRMFGRGSVDTKAGLAAMMHALADIHAAGETPPCEVWLAAVVDEEFSFRGVVKLCEGLIADAAIVAEPTEMRCITASKGCLRWKIRVEGKSAHSAKPHLGTNAIQHMARLILELEKDTLTLAATAHPLLGPGTCNVGVIHGGVQVNFVPDHCEIEIDRRLLPGETATAVLEHYQELLNQLSTQFADFRATMEPPMLIDEALETAADSAIAQTAASCLGRLGRDGTPGGVPFCSDASKLSRAEIPTLIFGPGSIDQAHAAVEWVPTTEVEEAAAFYRDVAMSFGG